jgi:[protein-PII] uridylyltransferase
MANKSFLSIDERTQAEEILRPPSRPPDGDETRIAELASPQFSEWLGERLLDRMRQHPSWEASGPVALGSWSRGELAPKSDIDLLFSGPEDAAAAVARDFAKEGLKIRYRVPQDPADWREGVLPFDVLALYSARPLVASAEEKLARQKELLKNDESTFRKVLIKAMTQEREARTQRFDSISNYLEPNLKFGAGGLRDLEQALATRLLFSERFAHEEDGHAFDVLRYYKYFFLLVRQKLHLAGGATEILSAPEQRPISDWLGFREPKLFMREIQKGVSRVSFYADWVLEQATRSRARLKQVATRKLTNASQLLTALEEDPSVLMQNRVRLSADEIFKKDPKATPELGKRLIRFIDPSSKEAPLIALFRARLIDHFVPEFRRIVGHVQHDQYHRFTVDAHILQALRELKRVCRQPKTAGRLATLVKSLTTKEWKVLAFACLYHDIAKGREGDHSVEGVAVAQHDLSRFGLDKTFIKEVCWIVEEHLALSAAAFRENPHSPRTWQSLADKGVRGRRLALLAVFTIVDIRATNPDAWTPWKERLLAELIEQFEKPEAGAMIVFAEALDRAKLPQKEKWVETLDPFFINSVPAKVIVEDLKFLCPPKKQAGKQSLPIKVIRLRGGKQTWVRFHSLEDRPGLFHSYVRLLSAAGLSIRHASIHTDIDLGVYDWFEVKSSKPAAAVEKILIAAASRTSSVKTAASVVFDAIELVSADEREWVLSFRGKDQSGALMEAARALFEEGVEIRWAKVHTWGRQIDDIFGIVPLKEADLDVDSSQLIEKLKRKFVHSSVNHRTKV